MSDPEWMPCQMMMIATEKLTLYGIGELITSVKINVYYNKKIRVQVSNYK